MKVTIELDIKELATLEDALGSHKIMVEGTKKWCGKGEAYRICEDKLKNTESLRLKLMKL